MCHFFFYFKTGQAKKMLSVHKATKKYKRWEVKLLKRLEEMSTSHTWNSTEALQVSH